MNRTILTMAGVFSASSLLLIDSAVKGTALLLLAAGGVLFLRRDSAATRHLVWLLSIIAMLVLPLLSAMLPQWRVLPEWAGIAREPAVVITSSSKIAEPEFAVAEWRGNDVPDEVERPISIRNQPPVESLKSLPLLTPPAVVAPTAVWSRNWLSDLPFVWSIGFCVLILRLMAARLMLWNTERQGTIIWSPRQSAKLSLDPLVIALQVTCQQLRLSRPVTLLIHSDKSIPVVWGLFRSRLLLPVSARDWSDEQLRSVLLHELAHIKRHDTTAQLLSQVACALHWFNPLVWFANWRLSVERERACDDLVLASGVRPSTYAGHLLQVVTDCSSDLGSPTCGLAMARKSSIESRLVAILSNNLNRRGVSMTLAAIALAIGLGIAVPVAMLRAVDDTNTEPKSSEKAPDVDIPEHDISTDMVLDPTTATGVNAEPDAVKPRHKDAQSLFRKLQACARTDGKIPGGLIGHLAREVDSFLKRYPGDENALKLSELRLRLDLSHDWEQADVVALLNGITAISTVPIRMVDISIKMDLERTLQRGKPLPAELTDAAWGTPVENGLRAAWLLEPRADQYPHGTVLKSRVLFHNSGKEPVSFQTAAWHQFDTHTARDANGDEIKVMVSDVEQTGVTPLAKFRLASGEYSEVLGHDIAIVHDIAIGIPKYDEPSADAIIKAKVGDEVHLWHTVDASRADWTRPKDPKDPSELWKKRIAERVEREAPMPATADDRDQLIRRVTLDIIGESPSVEELAAFVADNSPDALTTLTVRLQSKLRVPTFAGKLPTGVTKFRVTVADPKAATVPQTANAPQRSVLGEKLDPSTEEKLKWGEPMNGLRAAVVIGHPTEQPKADEIPDLYVVVQNVSEAPIRLNDTLAEQQPRMLYIKIEGRIQAAIGAQEPRLGDALLQKGEVAFGLMYSVKPLAEGRSMGQFIAEGVLKNTNQTLVAELQIEKAPAGAWTGKLVTGETGGTEEVATPQPKGKEAQSLFKVWLGGSRKNGKIPGGALGPLIRVMANFAKLNPTHEAAPKFTELIKRIDTSHDWTPSEAVSLLDEVTDIYASLPSWVEGEKRFSLGGVIQTGQLLPEQLENAPWGESQPDGLRVAWLLDPNAEQFRLGASLKSRILFHNTGKNTVVFRALTWNQDGAHKARDATGAEIETNSTHWTTIPMVLPCRLAPGEFLEVVGAGIGVGPDRDKEDWRGTRVGTWIQAKVGDEVTFIPAPVSASGKGGFDVPPDGESGWWLDFIKDRLSLELPLPAEADEREYLLVHAVRDIFGTAPTQDEIKGLVTDPANDAIDRLAKRLAERERVSPFTGYLQSGETKFRVLALDPDAGKRPRVVNNPGYYTLGENIRLSVSRRADEGRVVNAGARIVNEATIQFFSSDPQQPAPGEPHVLKLPDGYGTWAVAWRKGTSVLWLQKEGTIRSYDFTNPKQVRETDLSDPASMNKIPGPILEALRTAIDVPGGLKQKPAAPKTEGAAIPPTNPRLVDEPLRSDKDLVTLGEFAEQVQLMRSPPTN